MYVLDCSASMLRHGRLALAKGLLADWFAEAARTRSQVALICHGGRGARLVFGPAVPRWWNERWIQPIAGGGGTPLQAGLAMAETVLRRCHRRDPGLGLELWLLSDEHCPAAGPPSLGSASIIDVEPRGRVAGGARRLAHAWQAAYLQLTPQGLSQPGF